MYIHSSKANRNGRVSRNRRLVESYRDEKSGQPRKRIVQHIEKLPLLERARLIYRYGGQNHLDNEEWQALSDAGDFNTPVIEGKIGDAYNGAGTAILRHYAENTNLKSILSHQLGRKNGQLILDMIYQQILRPDSKLTYVQRRLHSLSYLLEGKEEADENTLYRAMDELENNFTGIRHDLNQNGQDSNRLLLYDLSNSYFTGMKAEIGGYGESKEKRYDRYIVSYGLVVNQDNIPLDIAIWPGGTADTQTVKETFKNWREKYQASQAVWVADRAMSSQENLNDIEDLDLSYITGMPTSAQVATLSRIYEESPELFDYTISEYTIEGKRYVLCRHDSKGYYREKQNQKRRRRIYHELLHIQKTPQNKNQNKLYHRVMKVLEKYEQTDCWHFDITSYQDNKNQTRYQLSFRLLRDKVHLKDTLGHYYLLQTNLNKKEMEKEEVKASYKSLLEVERSFRTIKTHMEIRPIRHWRANRIRAHIYLNFLALWLVKHIEHAWKASGIHHEVVPWLVYWDEQLKLNEVLDDYGQIIDMQWNKGEQSKEIIDKISAFGELGHIKPQL